MAMKTVASKRRESPESFSRLGILVLVICWATVVADGYDVVVFGAVVPSLLAEPGWGLTPAGVGVIGSLALTGMFIGSLVVGNLTDRYGRRRMLIACVIWFSVLTGLCAFAPGPEAFGVLRFLSGVGLGGVLPTASALVGEYSPKGKRNFVYAVMYSGFPIGGILAALVGLVLIPAWGWRSMFLVGLIPLLIIVPVAVRWLPESIGFLLARGRRDQAQAIADSHGISLPNVASTTATKARPVKQRGSVGQIFSARYRLTTICFCVASFLCLFMIYGLNTWLPQIMRQSGYSLGSALSFLLVFNIGAVVGTILISTLADRIGSRQILLGTFILASVSVALLTISLPTVALYVLVACGGVGVIATQSFILAFVSKVYPVAISATALGWSLGIGRLGSVAAPPVLGLIVGSALAIQWNFWAIAIPGLLGAVAIALIPRGQSATDDIEANLVARQREESAS
jgi:AAHS family benzoate transporter-like MFS transporter